MPPLPRPARYFPVKPLALRMEAGLLRHGTDLGNGPADGLFFQVDDELPRYLEAKRRVPAARHALLARDEQERAIHAAVDAWLRATLGREHPERLAALAELGVDPTRAGLLEIARVVQEDLVVIRRLGDGGSAAIGVHVSSPSCWRPERIHGASFGAIHGPVPDFAKRAEAERSMVDAMVERGPYVRFVWTVAADDHLDHHPEESRRAPWREDGPGFLRVERQTTVPFPEHAAALFLIRVYLYPFASLTAEQRGVLARALELMPADVARYKSLDAVRETIAAVLERSYFSPTT
ncbi:MAG: heme-dependent oxidative N-demethylase subunit alpha family protein [Thermodesulfobacteriota bacterium]